MKTILRGFRETIFLAIKLNRTIVPPPFYKHGRTDESQKDDEGNLIVQSVPLSDFLKTFTLSPGSLRNE